ncbi:MAG TPA: thiamine-phosphate kinase [Sphingomicrobium sp.]|jgi:thiamine-monophosphate kinase|nr:thiamine-phosphate kinase [Sphingomicrobium sp.]
MNEREVIARLKRIATDPAARGLADDAALLDGLVITHDTIAEGVHFLPVDPPASVGWKLVAVNLSDLAAKGAAPRAVLLSMTIGDKDWDEGFLSGIEAACESYGVQLIGGDTIALPEGAPRVLGLTAIGKAGERVPSRGDGRPGDILWLVGTLGDSAAGLAQLGEDPEAIGPLVDQYRRPVPLLAAGQVLAREASAMMDVSDGLLLDLQRLCEASSCGAEIDLDALPLSSAFAAERGEDREARLFAATGGDDYALLVALPAGIDPLSLSLPSDGRITAIGRLAEGCAIALRDAAGPVELPERRGYEHHRV